MVDLEGLKREIQQFQHETEDDLVELVTLGMTQNKLRLVEEFKKINQSADFIQGFELGVDGSIEFLKMMIEKSRSL